MTLGGPEREKDEMDWPAESEEGGESSGFGFPEVDTSKVSAGLKASGVAFGSGLLVIGKGLGRVGTWLVRENQGHWGSVLVQIGLGFQLGYVYGILR